MTGILQEVCKDLDGVSTWYFDPELHKYMRLTQDGKQDKVTGGVLSAHLFGEHLPNPHELFRARVAANNTNENSVVARRLKPSPVTYALYNHWQNYLSSIVPTDAGGK